MHTRVKFLKHHYQLDTVSTIIMGIYWGYILGYYYPLYVLNHIKYILRVFEYHRDRTLIEPGSSGIYLEYRGTYLVDIGELTNNRLPSGKLT